MFRFGIALLVIGGMLGYIGFKEVRLAGLADAEPQQISVKDIAEKGYGDNAHVVLTDAFVALYDSVQEYKENNESHFTKVWIPVVPRDGDYAQRIMSGDDSVKLPADTRVILISDEHHSVSALRALENVDKFHGLIINEIDSLGSRELEELQKGIAHVDFQKAYLVEFNRKPAGGRGWLMVGGGVVLILGGIGCFVAGAKRS